MASVLSQLPVHCGPLQALKEPDGIPEVKYLFSRDLEPMEVEQLPGTTSDIKLDLDIDHDEVIHSVTCEDTSSLPVDVAPKNVELVIDQVEIIDIVTCEDTSCPPVDATPNDVELNIGQDEVIDLITCEESNDIPTDAPPEDVLTPPSSCKDFEEPVALAGNSVAKPRCGPKLKKLSISLNKLRVATNYKSKKPELEEDEYIYCSNCDKLQIGVCPVHCNLRWVKEPSDVSVAEGLTKARATIPSNMDLKSSSIPDAGLGIFATERFQSDVVFGPYWGQKIAVADVTPNMDQSYMWDIIENGRVTHVVDARDENDSNWLRFVNCARNEDEQNLVAFQYRGEIYYRSYKMIEPGMELLVWYGDRYACDLDILDKDKKPADGPIQCQKCFMICSGPNSLASHNKFRCQMNNEHDRWRCMHCDRSFKTQTSLHLHKNIHKGLKPFTCRICGKAFSHRGSRNRHYSLHTGRESVSCKICGKGLIDGNSLKSHMRKVHHWRASFALHSTDKQYECKQCKKCFASQRNLKRHKKIHERPESINCRTCGKLFRNESNLLKHEALHKTTTGVRKCKHCGQCFHSGVALSNHMRTHKTETALNTCSICKFTFTLSSNLARHMREKHRGVKVFKCGKCSKVCPNKGLLALHVTIRHPAKRSVLKQRHAPELGKAKKRMQHSQKEPSELDSIKCKHRNLALPGNKLHDHIRIHQKTNKITNTMAKQVVGLNKGHITSIRSRDSFVTNQGSFTCEFCFRVFPSSKLMHCHRASHFRKVSTATPIPVTKQSTVPTREGEDCTELNRKEWRCKICDKEFSSVEKFRSHSVIHFRKRRLNLQECQQRIPDAPNPGRSSMKPTGRYCCHTCNKSFRTERSLRSHKTHHSRLRALSFVSPNPLLESSQSGKRQGINNHSGGSGNSSSELKLFGCDTCGKAFHSKATLASHKGHHRRENSLKYLHTSHIAKANFTSKIAVDGNAPKPYECSKCLRSFKYRHHLASHELRFHVRVNTKFVCPFCDRSFSTKESLLAHKKLLHNTGDSFTCLKCNSQFSSEYSRNRHVCRTVERKESSKKSEGRFKSNPTVKGSVGEHHVCNVCLLSFQFKQALSNHKRSHAGAKFPFVCSICHRGLSSKESLLRHRKRSHAGANAPFICSICHQGLSSKKSLLRHRKSQHSKTTSTDHLYNGQFASKGSQSDQKSSAKERKVSAVKASNLKVNCGVEERHVCNRCFESFQSKQALRNHKRSHNGRGAPFICSVCHVGLSSKSSLLRHREKRHNTEASSHLPYNEQFPLNYGLDAQKKSSSLKSNSPHILQFPYVSYNKRFLTYDDLNKHKSTIHAENKPDSAASGQTNIEVADHQGLNAKTQSSSSPCKFQPCEKDFQTASPLHEHVNELHAGREMLHSQQENRTDVKGTNNPWKCKPCNKEFQTEFGITRHVEKRHNKRIWLDRQRGCKSEAKSNSSPWKFLYCQKEFRSFHGVRKHALRKHPGRRTVYLQQSCKPQEKGQVEIGVSNVATETGMCAGRAFRCQYCHKGFSSIKGRYKHFLLAHRLELVSPSPARDYSSENCFATGHKDAVHTESLAQQSGRKAGQDEISTDTLCLNEVKSSTGKQVVKPKPKRPTIGCSLRCRYFCGRRFFCKSSRRRHERSVHEKRVSPVSVSPKQKGRKIDKGDLFDETAFSSEELTTSENCEGKQLVRPSSNRLDAKVALGLNVQPRDKLFSCQRCPRPFFSVSARYKHILLAHSEDACSCSVVRHLGTKAHNGRWASKHDEKLSSYNGNSNASPDLPVKRKRPMLRSSGQPSPKKAKPQKLAPVNGFVSETSTTSVHHEAVPSSRRHTSVKAKAFPCGFCRKSFSACSLRYKHFLLVHSGSNSLADEYFLALENGSVRKPPQTSSHRSTSQGNVSKGHNSNQTPVSQSKARENRFSFRGSFSEVASNFKEDSEAFKCRTCSICFRSRDDWYSHFKEKHHSGKALCRIRSPCRPALRTISTPFQGNSVKTLRNRHTNYFKVTRGKELSERPAKKAKIQDKRFQCDICRLALSNKWTVARNKDSQHCDEKPFQCKVCGFATKRKDYLNLHKRERCKE